MRGGGRGRKRGRGKVSGGKRGRGGGNAAASTVDSEAGLEKQQPTSESRASGMAHREQEPKELKRITQKDGMKGPGVNKATIKGLASGGSMAGVATSKRFKVPTGSHHVNKRKKVMGVEANRPPSAKEVMHADEEGLPSPLPGKLSSTEKDHVVRIETSTSKKMEKVGQIMSEKKLEHENVHLAVEMKQMEPAATADPVLDTAVVEVGESKEEKVISNDIMASKKGRKEGSENSNGNAPLLESGAGQQQVDTAGGQETSKSRNETSLTKSEKATFGLVSSTVNPKSSKPAESSACATTGTTLGGIDVVLTPWFLSGGTPNFRPKGASQAGNKDSKAWMELQSCTAGLGERHHANATDSDCTTYSTVQNAIKSEKDASRHFDSKLLQALLHDS